MRHYESSDLVGRLLPCESRALSECCRQVAFLLNYECSFYVTLSIPLRDTGHVLQPVRKARYASEMVVSRVIYSGPILSTFLGRHLL